MAGSIRQIAGRQGIPEQVTDAIRFQQTGTENVLQYIQQPLAKPAANEILISQQAIGVNFVDTYYRSGLYPASLPSGLGTEAAGIVEATGSAVTHVKPGDRVAYAQGPLGAYAKKRLLPADLAVKIPEGISFETAAATLLKGMTVYYLLHDVFSVKPGQTILFHAAAGGVGLLACQWARYLGARLIGTVSSEEKAAIASAHGAWQTINYSQQDVATEVLHLTAGEKVPVVYDSIGQATWETSLNCLQPRGLMVSYGNASGPVTGINLAQLSQKGSLFVTRPVLAHYADSYNKRQQIAAQLFSLLQHGAIKAPQPQVFALKDAAAAHRELQNRNRTGSIILIP